LENIKSTKKILFVIDRLESGGAEKQMIKLAELCSSDHDVYITSLYPPQSSAYELIESSKLKYVSLSISDSSFIGRVFNIAARYFALKKLILTLKPECCVSFLEWSNIYSVLCSKESGIKTYCNVRNYLSIQYGSRSKYILKIAQAIIARVYPKATKILCNSYAIKDDLVNNFNIAAEQVDVVFNSYDIEFITQQGKMPVDFSLPLVECQYKSFLSIGRLSDQKRFYSLIQNFVLFQQKTGRRDHLLIVGEGPLEGELKQLSVGHNISIIDYQVNPYSVMAKCDCFILHSEFEGFPNVLAEACILNMDILSVDCLSGPREILSGGKVRDYGLIIDSVSPMDNGILYPRSLCPADEDMGLVGALAFYVSGGYIRREKVVAFLSKEVGDARWLELLSIQH